MRFPMNSHMTETKPLRPASLTLMSIILTHVASFAATGLFGIIFASSSICHAGEWTRTSSTTITFHGVIEKGELSRFLAIYRSSDTTLIVDSTGGQMDAALEIGKTLLNNPNLTVVVRGICASSCANYLFLAGQTKVIDHGIVGFHGNWKAMYESEKFRKEAATIQPGPRAKLLAWHRQKVKEESEFLRRAGAAQELFDKTQRENDQGSYDIYLPGPSVFRDYGIRNVIGNQDAAVIQHYSGLKLHYDNGPAVPATSTFSGAAVQ